MIAYTATGSAPVVGNRTGVLAATGKPVEAVTLELPPMNAAALASISTPSAHLCVHVDTISAAIT